MWTRWTVLGLVAGIAIAVAVAHLLGDPSRPDVGHDIVPAPVGGGGTGLAPNFRPGRTATAGRPGAPAHDPSGVLVVRGRVVRLDMAGQEESAGTGVLVFSFAGERAERIVQTTTDEAGAFELREDLTGAEARGRGARERGVVAESHDGPSCSFPVFVSVEGSIGVSPASPPISLTLQPGILIRGQLVDRSGRAVPHAQCVARWLLPPGAHVREQDGGSASPRHSLVDADDEGRFELVLPAGHVQVRGRRGPGGGLGAAQEVDIGTEPRPPPLLLVLGAEDAQVRLRVTARDGAPIPSAMAMLRSADVIYAVTSPALDRRDVGAIFGDVSGSIRIDGVSREAAPFVVGLGAPGYLPQRIEISPTDSFPKSVVLDPKLLAIGTLRPPDGSDVEDLEVEWDVGPADLVASDAARSMARSDDVLELVEEQIPKTEWARDPTSGGWNFRVPEAGRYDVAARIEGLPPRHAIVDFAAPTSRFFVPLPAGRRVTLRAEFPQETFLRGYSWRLSVTGAPVENSTRPPSLQVSAWEPTPESPELKLWCPDEVTMLRVGPSTRADLPAMKIEVPVPPVASGALPVRLVGVRSGTLELRYESPPGTPRPGVELEILAISSSPADGPRGIRWVRTDDRGLAALAVPEGEYFVGRSRSYGDPLWTRARVGVGAVTPVLITR